MNGDQDFLLAVRSRIAPGHSFRAMPIRAVLARADAAEDLLAALQSRGSEFLDVLFADVRRNPRRRGVDTSAKDGVAKHGIRVRVEGLPEGVYVAWCMLACDAPAAVG